MQILKYFDPPKLDDRLLKVANITAVREVSIKPFEGALPLNCLNNSNAYTRVNGGDVQLGWILSILGNVALKLTAHAVVKNKGGSLICVTPNPYRKNKLRFVPDPTVAKLIQNNHLPVRFIPLTQNETLNEFLEIEREMDRIRLQNSGLVDNMEFQMMKVRQLALYPAVLELARKHTTPNQYCYCGSNKKRNKCCG